MIDAVGIGVVRVVVNIFGYALACSPVRTEISNGTQRCILVRQDQAAYIVIRPDCRPLKGRITEAAIGAEIVRDVKWLVRLEGLTTVVAIKAIQLVPIHDLRQEAAALGKVGKLTLNDKPSTLG